MQPLFLVVVAGIAIAIAIAYNSRQKAHIAAARALAAHYGFELDVAAKPPPNHDFDLFDIGRSKRVSFQLWRAGEQDSVFQYQYTTGSGDNKRTCHHTCALISLPFVAPHTKLGPEGFWSGIGRAVGIRDIEVESPDFNDQYRVTSDDERFAIALLDQPMIAWLLSNQSGRGAIRFEIWGPWLLCVSDRLEFEVTFGFLDWAQGVRSHMPVVLNSLYPRR